MPVRTEIARKAEKLLGLLQGKSTMLIVMQDYPDPDAIAAAAGLRELANARAGIQCSIAHGGIVGRAENRELVKYLGLNLRTFDDLEVGRFDLVALVDTQPRSGNNALDPAVTPQIVIDHHPIRHATRSAAFTDVRGKYGATATIIYEYLRHCAVEIPPPLATALLYGIRSDTQELGRVATQADIDAVLQLYPLANTRMLRDILRGRVPPAYFRMLMRGIANATQYGEAILSNLGDVDNPDMIGEVADMLLRAENSSWVLCYGAYAGRILLSLRTSDTEARADRIMHKIIGRKGTGGGHNTMAGGQIPIGDATPRERRQTETTILRRFLRRTGVRDQEPRGLAD